MKSNTKITCPQCGYGVSNVKESLRCPRCNTPIVEITPCQGSCKNCNLKRGR
ncbi:MAG: hypothetical protein GX088_06765 [Clostridia bacterium]|nr:hypothetical protein [Clostridia bacterium]